MTVDLRFGCQRAQRERQRPRSARRTGHGSSTFCSRSELASIADALQNRKKCPPVPKKCRGERAFAAGQNRAFRNASLRREPKPSTADALSLHVGKNRWTE